MYDVQCTDIQSTQVGIYYKQALLNQNGKQDLNIEEKGDYETTN